MGSSRGRPSGLKAGQEKRAKNKKLFPWNYRSVKMTAPN
jgi:hypothetical protein